MELDRLTLENFRQFHGQQSIEFSRDDERNVTVIHGANGSGKTTLLNAFIWLFYDEITLSQPNRVANERALAEASPNEKVVVRVELDFDHDGRQYTAERVNTYQKSDEEDLNGRLMNESISLEYIDTDGNHKSRANPNSSLKQIMPERLREIFFFDGETIDELSAHDSQDKVQSAIRNIMGLEILERAIRHLKTVENRFETEIERHGSNELQEFVREKQDLEQQLQSMEEQLSNAEESKSQTEEELASVADRLSELEQSQELQDERERLQDNLFEIEQEIGDINDDLRSAISDRGHLPFAMTAVEDTAKMLQEKRRKGEIPSEIKEQFVEDLLELEECICGRPLTPGTEARDEVAQWQERAGSSELEESAMQIAGRLSEIGSEQEKLFEDIDRLLERRSRKADQRRSLEERIDEISTSLTEEETEDVASLESRRIELEEKRDDLTKRIGSLETDIDELEEELDEVKTDIEEAREENELANTARRRAQTAAYLRDRLEHLFDQYQDEVRESVNERVNEIFKEIIEKDFYAEISDRYTLRILKDVGSAEGQVVAKSTGERQVASLAFISTLISLAKERYESDEDATYFTGGIYPMLMDSPFGYLDPTYQRRVSRMLPEMASQVIVLVTQSQWSEEVAGEMNDVAGERYKLQYHDPREDPSVEYEYTEIVEEAVTA